MGDGQKTPHGHLNFISYVQNLRVFVFQTDGRTDRRTDGLMDGDINPVWAGYPIGSSRLSLVISTTPKVGFGVGFGR